MNYKEKIEKIEKELKEIKEEIGKETIKVTIPEQRLEWGELLGERLTWEEAKEWCNKQGDGWRLPTDVELLQAYRDDVIGFGTGYHWSSTEDSTTGAKYVFFSDGSMSYSFKMSSCSVRCVRGW